MDDPSQPPRAEQVPPEVQAAPPAKSKPATGNATTSKAATKPSATTLAATDEAIQTLRRNQQVLQRSIETLTEDARKSRDANGAQFTNINSALAEILQSIRQPATQPAAQATTSADSGVQSVPARASTESSAEDSFIGFPEMPSTAVAAPPSNIPASASFMNIAPVAPQVSRKLYDLPTFSGLPEEWPKFFMRYQQTTAAYGYTALDNSIRLQNCLTGEAKEAVDCLLLDGNQTAAVIATLEFRFGRPELLAQTQLRHVREILPIPETRPELIVPFASKVANMLTYIDQPKTRQYLDNPELLEQMVQKLPLSRRHEWGRYSVDIKPCADIRNFSTWLMDLARCVSKMTPAATLAAATLPTASTRTNNRRERMLHAAVSEPRKCDYCGAGAHDVKVCRRLLQHNVSERWDTVRANRLCFTCLRRGHGSAQCSAKDRCGVDNCTRPHHNLLHTAPAQRRNPFDRGQRSGTAEPSSNVQAAQATTGENATSGDDNAGRERVHNCRVGVADARIMFRIVPVKLYGEQREVRTFALLDEGSSVTLLDDNLAADLGLTGPLSSLDLQWFGGRCATEKSRTVALRISGIGNGTPTYNMANVRTVRQLDLPTQTVKMSELSRRFQRLRGLPVHDYEGAVPKILIGLDNVHLGVATHQVSCAAPGPVATRTKLGWIVCGPMHKTVDNAVMLHNSIAPSPTDFDELHQAVKEYFSLESFGVRHPSRALESQVDTRALQILRRTTAFLGDKYETGLLWRRGAVSFPDSKEMATNRLLSVERKMKRDRDYANEYASVINGFVAKGYARRLSTEEAAVVDNRTWYLPHFAVVNPNKPGKMRVVFDAAAIANGVSLNSELLKGPDLNRPLLAVLHQFRVGAVGVCADIKEMFLQVRIRAADVNAQRFLWRGGDPSQPIGVYVMDSMIFGAACSPCVAQYVKNTNADAFKDRFPAAVKLIHDAHYVDDLVASFDTEEDAASVCKAIVDIHRHGGFELRGFLSNSTAVLQAIGEGTHTASTVDMQLDVASAEKILGMYWSTCEDAFLFRLAFNRVDPAVVDGSRRPTKRELLSATMSVYDPFGILANFTIYAKLLLQDLWRHGTAWDEPIPEDLHSKWLQWVAKLDVCRQIRVQRCYHPNIAAQRVQLHMFADASQSAFATVAYWRVEVAPSQWRVVFIAGKSRCAPPKLISVPRLELQAAILAVRLSGSIRALHDFAVERTFFWTDSKTVVQWVRSDRMQFRPFVAHRIAEILEETSVADWHWVPTLHNAADDATRAKYPVRFEARNRWIHGPEFLAQEESRWPAEPAQLHCEDGAEEVRSSSVHLVCSNSTHTLLQITGFSDLHRACRTMAIVLRFVRNLRPSTRRSGELQPDEIDGGLQHLILDAQREAFPRELAALRQGETLEKSSPIHGLLPHIDQHGVLRVTGRIDRATHLPEDTRNPVILPKNHHLTTILVAMYHRRLRHQQQAAVVCEIRQKYWIPHLRVIVRRVKSACMFCRIKHARAVEPVMGQLPSDRLTPFVRPFTYTGVDYFGPIFVTVGRRREKRWVALFTCMTIRAVHLELASDLSTDACILCLRNFMNMRGVPKRIRSDNGTNFVGASRELREAIDMLDHAAIQRELGTKSVEWIFNCPSNPEAGGCWERLVQSVKRVLSVTVKEVAPHVETMRSLLLEAANIVNSRPLTQLPVNNDDDEPLTPNHFLLGTSNSTQTPGPVDDKPICLRKQWRVSQALKDRFWKRWLLEYLPDLTRRAKGHNEQPALVVGSLVLICDSNLPRGQWRRGRVVQVYPGIDGRIRTALIKTSDGELKRPVTKLAVLDVYG